MRSVPLRCFGEVSAISAPQSNALSAIRISSVAMMTRSKFLARLDCSQTRCRRDFPAITCNGFPGKRVELQRAGIMATALFISCRGTQNYLHRGWNVIGNPVRYALGYVGLNSGSHPDGPHARVMTAFDVDLLIAD